MQDQEMKALVRGFVRWMLRIGIALNVILWLAVIQIYCQDHIKLHTDRDEWEESIGLKFVTITNKDDRLVYFYQTRKLELRQSSLGFDKDTRYDYGNAKKPYEFTGCFVVFYCRKHLMSYFWQRVPCYDNDKPELPNK